jgi:predicted dehydrogenase
MLTAGIIGLGVGERFIQPLEEHPKVHLKTLCDFNENKLNDFKASHPQKIFTADSNIVLSDTDINFIAIASYDNFHTEQIVSALNNKKHVFVEKPICLYQSELDEIFLSLERNPECKISSNFVLRTNPLFKRLKQDIQSGDLGQIFYIEADYLWGRISKLDGWRAEMGYYSIVHGAAIHMIDLIVWLLDEKPYEVKTYGNNIATQDNKLNYNSFAVMLLNFKSGLIVKITGNGGCVHPHFHSLKIFGTKKTISHDMNGSFFIESTDSKNDLVRIGESYPAKNLRKNVLVSFVESIVNETNAIVKRNDIFDTISISLSAEKSMINNTTEKIEYKF